MAPRNSRRSSVRDGLRTGTGQVIPLIFDPNDSSATPESLFPVGSSPSGSSREPRFVHWDIPDLFLVYTDGACLRNGQNNPTAGCGVVFGPESATGTTRFGLRLETLGPTGEEHTPTNNRAELRAVIAATRFLNWRREGFRTMVIATDSAYVVDGITKWMPSWIRQGWRNSQGNPVLNRDLWECLLGEVERWDEKGMEIIFWHIRRRFNTEADHYAGIGSRLDYEHEFQDYAG